MDNSELWLTPLILIPGTAMLIMSTSARYAQIHAEFHHLIEEHSGHRADRARRLMARSRLFRNALILLYSSVCLFAVASFVGGLTVRWPAESRLAIMILLCTGILSMIIAAITLVQETFRSSDIFQEHFQEILDSDAE